MILLRRSRCQGASRPPRLKRRLLKASSPVTLQVANKMHRVGIRTFEFTVA